MTAAFSITDKNRVHPAFELINQHYIPALSAEFLQYRHRATGALHYHLAADNDENVFLVAFRTQPMDSRGVAHILEHTALCGSQKYPVRDPFFSMIRRSLNTFMNAFTAADWTAYPFATQNKTDFYNLLSVYLDAAFFANLNELDFAQEGIRIELEDDKPVYKGIVFNEMKGAMSSPSDQLYHTLAHYLYPETTYHYNSGGNPADIPDLSHHDLIEFYKSHYHPSNAVFMSFGNLAPVELQTHFEEQALKNFGQGETLKSVPERRLAAPVKVEDVYAVDSEELAKKTYIQFAWLLPPSTDIKTRLALRLIEGVLMEHSASPLRQYLETCGLGESTSPIMGLDDSNFEMTFFCGLQGSEADKAEELEAGIFKVLQDMVNNPIDSNQIEAVLHQIELHQREISGDGMPYGLTLLLNGLGSAIHGGDPLDVWQIEPHLAELREQLKDPAWLPQLIRQYLIDNPHRVRLTLKPDPEKSARDQAAEQARLDAVAQQLDDDKRQQLIEQAKLLEVRQAQEDDLSLLPKVGLADIPAELHIVKGQTTSLNVAGQAAPFYQYAAGTNGLYYQQVLIQIPDDVLQSPLLGIYTSLVGELGASEMSYLDIQQAQALVSGGLHLGASFRSDIQDSNKTSSYLVLATKALNEKTEALGLLRTAFEQLRFDEKDRILELLQQRKARWQSRLSGAGHSYALQTASRHMSALARRDYYNAGLPALVWLKNLVQNIEQDDVALNQLIADLQQLHERVLSLPKQFLLVAEQEKMADLSEQLAQVWQQSNIELSNEAKALEVADHPVENNDLAWLIQANVQFCAAAYPAVPVNHPDACPLMVLGPYLKNGFLHRALREQGGAYGGGASYDGNACAFRFHSYRDPRLSETFKDFAGSIDWLLNEKQEPHQLEEAIMGLIASMDKPGSPAGEAITACHAMLHGRTPEFRQQMRSKLLEVTLDDLKRVARQYIQAKTPVRAVVAPYAKSGELQELNFNVEQV
ncbi:insulinase family protein [Alkanindiges illinoisensis]|uniref:Peptidase M16 n=1 Tax=Alkanindiges illinoisensis TaxID=197183 RepID=A0A4Y7XG92_9GAMM|nr:insulinase family protein [Alkanindiges illinoisensis]TEU30543.1 peptidase M16 [Alkanindiges illinoisensis]